MCGCPLLWPDVDRIYHESIWRWLQIVENGHGQFSKKRFHVDAFTEWVKSCEMINEMWS
jgi:hypothetical protein